MLLVACKNAVSSTPLRGLRSRLAATTGPDWSPGRAAKRGPWRGRPRRALVTGSRYWTDGGVIRRALAQVWGEGTAVLVFGVCPHGAGRIVGTARTRWGGHVERYPADGNTHGRVAGYRRN
jgi:hypothetical protein